MVLQDVEGGPPRLIEHNDLAIDYGFVGECRERLHDVSSVAGDDCLSEGYCLGAEAHKCASALARRDCGTLGGKLPPQYRRKPARCHPTTVSGFTMTRRSDLGAICTTT
jgi:hypothetical protein